MKTAIVATVCAAAVLGGCMSLDERRLVEKYYGSQARGLLFRGPELTAARHAEAVAAEEEKRRSRVLALQREEVARMHREGNVRACVAYGRRWVIVSYYDPRHGTRYVRENRLICTGWKTQLTPD